MKFQRFAILSIVIFALAAGSLAAAPELTLSADRDDCIYSLGDTVAFSVGCDLQGAVVEYRLSSDGAAELRHGTLQLSGGKAVVRGTLDRPGVLRLDVTASAGADTVHRAYGCAIEPLAVRSTGVMPGDFDRFWAQAKAELFRVPMDVKIEKIEDDEQPSTLYLVSYANIEGSRINCWYRVPPGDGPFPAVLTVPGAGVRKEGTRESYADAGYAVLTVSIHGIGQQHEQEFYDRMRRGLLSGYPYFGMDDPYRFYYRRVILGALRGLDFLAGRPEVDSTRMVVAGSSQGGGMSLIVAALDKRIKALAGNVPALCDHSGILHGRPSGWPRLLRRAGDEERGRVMRTIGYYDAALMASRIEVPALLSCGLIDGTCAPTSVLSAFNNLKGPRAIEIVPAMGHAAARDWDELSFGWLHDALEGKLTGTRIIRGKR